MESRSRNGDLIPQGRRNWFQDDKISSYNKEEKKLELKLGPPGEEDEEGVGLSKTRHIKKEPKDKSIILSLSGIHFSPSSTTTNNKTTSHKRTAPGQVVGWPPVRSFRKNLANGSSSKLGNESTSKNQKVDCDNNGEKTKEPNKQSGMFVKINMYGVPIGRKVDLNAHNSYEQLSFTVDKLFRGLLAAQRESSSSREEVKPINELLDGNGEYTLTYEDNEGDKMLVGDVPWQCHYSWEIWSYFVSRIAPGCPADYESIVDWFHDPPSSTHASIFQILKLLQQIIIYTLWRERNSRHFTAKEVPSLTVKRHIDRIMRSRLFSIRSKPGNASPTLLQIYFGCISNVS